MTAKECRTVFNGMIMKLAELYPDPTTVDDNARALMTNTVEMHKLQALWEIAAQLAELNASNGPRIVQ